jgi:hypothetical protein
MAMVGLENDDDNDDDDVHWYSASLHSVNYKDNATL